MEQVKKYRKPDYSKLKFSDRSVSSESALGDVTPFEWSDEVRSGKKKVVYTHE